MADITSAGRRACLALLWLAAPASTQEWWQLGGEGGLDWEGIQQHQIMADLTTAPGALQPRRFLPDENVPPVLGRWYERRFPDRLGAREYRIGDPRLWIDVNLTWTMPMAVLDWVDGDPTTLSGATLFEPYMFTMDFGAPIPVERIVLTVPDGRSPGTDEPYRPYWIPRAFEVWGAADDEVSRLEEISGFTWSRYDLPRLEKRLLQATTNTDSVISLEFDSFELLQQVRLHTIADALDAGGRDVVGRFILSEWEVFANGFAPDVTWESGVIDLARDVALGRVHFGVSRWRLNPRTGELSPALDSEAKVVLEMRSGQDPTPIIYNTYDDLGQLVEVPEEKWVTLGSRRVIEDPYGRIQQAGAVPGNKGPVVEDLEMWGPWSQPITASGTHPRLPWGQYLKLRASLTSPSPFEFARIDSVRVDVAPLLADRVVAEVAVQDELHPPGQVAMAEAGLPTEFVLDLKAEFDDDRAGFDGVRVFTPGPARLLWLEMGPDADGLERRDPEPPAADPSGLTVLLPARVTRTGDRQVRMGIETALYGLATEFSGEVFNRGEEDLVQRIEGGDAGESLGTNQLGVIGARLSESRVLGDLALEPRVLTPQGDGFSEEVRIGYVLFRATAPEVRVSVHRLDGARVWTRTLGPRAPGSHGETWTGEDDSGRLVPPGTYVTRVEVDTDEGTEARMAVLGVAY